METVILSALRLVIGTALFFFVPGFAVSVLLFPRKASLKSLERVLMAIIISIIISVTDSVICLITVGLTFVTLSLSMLAWSAVFMISALVRWRTLPTSDRLTIQWDRDAKYILTGVAALCLVVALIGITALSSHPTETYYSDFYVLDSNHQTLLYPSNVSVGTTSTLILGITNHETGPNTYAGTVKLNNATVYAFDNLELGQGQNLEKPLTIPFTSPGEHQKVQLVLTDSSMKSYELHLWVNVR
ncbi:MAG: DUF1616 domain-containing protein [Euryarchaeota archaeon]|nr:DUF1616 domain-containing protein [Euryarchaeota archaeon]